MGKERVMVNVRVEADPPRWYGHYKDIKGYMAFLQRWAKDFHEFIRDHRSQDPVNLSVIPEYEDRCSFCGLEWEEWDDGEPACCTKASEEWRAAKVLASLEADHE